MSDKLLIDRLDKRRELGSLRKLSHERAAIDLCSNDYLGFAKKKFPHSGENGSTGSRLISGNYPIMEELEQIATKVHKSEAALLFNSGYCANLGLLSAIAQKNVNIAYDALAHASIRDGIRLGFARSFSFRHNDLNDLEAKLKRAKGQTYVVVESVYSMDGDFAPIIDLLELREKYAFELIVDEAHAAGIFGKNGAGYVASLNFEDLVFARIITYGKAFGTHGAVVLGSNLLREYLVNFARSFIYTTAIAPESVSVIKQAYLELLKSSQPQEYLHDLIRIFNQSKPQHPGWIKSDSAIQSLMYPGNVQSRTLADILCRQGYDVRAILSPTVKSGSERLRICLHSFNSVSDIKNFLKALGQAI